MWAPARLRSETPQLEDVRDIGGVCIAYGVRSETLLMEYGIK